MNESQSKNIGHSAPKDQTHQDPPKEGSGPRLPFCGDLAMRIARDGTWFYQGSPIGRPAMVKLFSSVLRREADGSFWLVTPYERGRIVVEDAPFQAVECDAEGEGEGQRLTFRSNVDDKVVAGPEHPIRVSENDQGEPSPYVLIRPGLEARIVRSVFYRLVELAVPDPKDPSRLGLWSNGQFFPLGPSA